MHLKISFCILYYSPINSLPIFKRKGEGVITGYHGYLKLTSSSKTVAIVRNRDLGVLFGVLNFINE